MRPQKSKSLTNCWSRNEVCANSVFTCNSEAGPTKSKNCSCLDARRKLGTRAADKPFLSSLLSSTGLLGLDAAGRELAAQETRTLTARTWAQRGALSACQRTFAARYHVQDLGVFEQTLREQLANAGKQTQEQQDADLEFKEALIMCRGRSTLSER